MLDRVRAHIRIRGHVQGVGFRFSMQREAERLGVNGWVRNLPDGRVEAVAEGPRDAVEALVAWGRSGPPAARVEAVDVTFGAPEGEKPGFRIIG
ncbi:MAG: acylphosphatase [Hydrogenibacillus schlegelii]|uniref:Acylphosphatase n=1 Tax=Hydrogenibacillus schlegelii TaxID=1484 RepID=A0A947CX61_HYDSH|nr:acylphosphatase [Hydrogenibacillus schlegelii]